MRYSAHRTLLLKNDPKMKHFCISLPLRPVSSKQNTLFARAAITTTVRTTVTIGNYSGEIQQRKS